jgi:selenocysteine lyase/cysteine desulfurase
MTVAGTTLAAPAWARNHESARTERTTGILDFMSEATTNVPSESKAGSPSPASRGADMAVFREDFPILQRAAASGAALAYLDNAASAQHPRAVIYAITD